jgi:hypothetical protein
LEFSLEALLDTQHGSTVLLACLVVVLCLLLLSKLGELVLKFFEKKGDKDETKITEVSIALQANSEAVRELRVQVGVLLVEITQLRERNRDIDKVFSAVKILAGKKWPSVRKAMEQDVLPKG